MVKIIYNESNNDLEVHVDWGRPDMPSKTVLFMVYPEDVMTNTEQVE